MALLIKSLTTLAIADAMMMIAMATIAFGSQATTAVSRTRSGSGQHAERHLQHEQQDHVVDDLAD